MTSKTFFKKAIAFLLLLTIVLSSAIACDLQEGSQEKPQGIDHDFFGSNPPIDQQVVLNQSGIKITLTGVEIDQYGNPGFKFYIENNNSDSVKFNTSSPYVNGVLFDTNIYTDTSGTWFTYLDLYPNSEQSFVLSFDKALLLELGIIKISSFDFSVSAYSSTNTLAIPKYLFNSQPVSIKTKLYDGSKQELSASGITIYEKDGIKIKINKYWGSSADSLYLASENNTDKDFAFSLTNIFVNEKAVSESSTNILSDYGELVYVPAKAVAVRPCYAITEKMIQNGISTINEISFLSAMGFAENPNSIWHPAGNPDDYSSGNFRIDFNTGICETLRFYDAADIKTNSLTLGKDKLSLLSEKDFSISLTSFDKETSVLNLEITNQIALPCQYYFHNIKINGSTDVITKDSDILKNAPKGTSAGRCSIARILPSGSIGGTQSGPIGSEPAFDPIESIGFELVVIDEGTGIIIYKAKVVITIPPAD